MADAGLIVLVSFISPFRAERRMARELLGDDRVPRDLRRHAARGCRVARPQGPLRQGPARRDPELHRHRCPYEAPDNPDVHISTAEYTPEEAADAVIRLLYRCRSSAGSSRASGSLSAVLRLRFVAGWWRVHRVVADQRVGEAVVEGRRPGQVERLPNGPDRSLYGLRIAAGDGQGDLRARAPGGLPWSPPR